MKNPGPVTVDIRMLRSSGIGTYLRNLVPLIIGACPDTKFYLLGKREQMATCDWAHADNVALVDCRAPIYSVAEQLDLFQKTPPDTALFWSPHYNIPLLYCGKLLVTVHDVFHLSMLEYVNGVHKRLYAKGMFGALRRKALTILTVSGFTKLELIRLSGQREQDIRVIYTGVDVSQFGTQNGPNPHPRPFLLYVGNVKPHKNVTILLRAFKLIKDKVIQDLVIVGKTHGFITEDDEVWAKSADLGARVHFTGYVEDDLLQQYLSHADALVIPSLYEGFGLPAVEAMASGCPVIASNIAALPEICGSAVLYCNPYSATDVANKIRLLASDVGLQEDLRSKGRERARQFTWSRCAEQTLDAIEQVLQSESKSPRHQADNGARRS